MHKIVKYLKKPSLLYLYLTGRGLFKYIPDDIHLRIVYKAIIGKKLDLTNPKSFNEKIQWLKLNDRKKVYTTMVDKYEAKKYVSKIIGEEYIIPTYGIYNSFDSINFDVLPDQFVIKCTHDSGGLIICKDKKTLDIKKAKRIIEKHFNRKYYYIWREWPYKNVKPRIIVEKYLEDNNNQSMQDYKFFCFNGVPKIMYLSEGLEDHSTATMSFFDMNFNEVDCKRKDYALFKYKPQKPKNFEKMKKFAAILSKNIPHLRVDFYEINGHLYFGELTFTTCAGLVPFEDEKWDRIMGDWIKLPTDK